MPRASDQVFHEAPSGFVRIFRAGNRPHFRLGRRSIPASPRRSRLHAGFSFCERLPAGRIHVDVSSRSAPNFIKSGPRSAGRLTCRWVRRAAPYHPRYSVGRGRFYQFFRPSDAQDTTEGVLCRCRRAWKVGRGTICDVKCWQLFAAVLHFNVTARARDAGFLSAWTQLRISRSATTSLKDEVSLSPVPPPTVPHTCGNLFSFFPLGGARASCDSSVWSHVNIPRPDGYH